MLYKLFHNIAKNKIENDKNNQNHKTKKNFLVLLFFTQTYKN